MVSQAYYNAAEHMACPPIVHEEPLDEHESLVRVNAMKRLRLNVLSPPSTAEVLDFDEAGEVC
jgi:hypothetical protein